VRSNLGHKVQNLYLLKINFILSFGERLKIYFIVHEAIQAFASVFDLCQVVQEVFVITEKGSDFNERELTGFADADYSINRVYV
jgi:hypothetical protein